MTSKQFHDSCSALILAAGKGKRMESGKTKVLHELAGKPMIDYVVTALEIDEIEQIAVVVSPQNIRDVRNVLGERVEYIVQPQQNGTGHAVLMAESWLQNFIGDLVVVVGDAPLIQKETIRELIIKRRHTQYACVLLSAIYKNPPPYGRIIRDIDKKILRIVEEKDATAEEKKIGEVSSSHYCFRSDVLFDLLRMVKNNNAQKEYYLTDTIELLLKKQKKVEAIPVRHAFETFGINSREDLIRAEKYLRKGAAPPGEH